MKSNWALKVLVFCSLALGVSAAYSDNDIIIGGPNTAPPQMDQQFAQNAGVRYTQELFHAANDPVAGNPGGKITLVEFFDFRCPHCDRMAPIVDSLIANNPDLRVIYKTFPILGSQSVFAAEAALASIPQGKYLQFHAALMRNGYQLNYDEVFSIAKSVGLNIPKFKAELGNEKIDSHIEANLRLGRSLGIIGTPVFFVAKTNLPDNAPPSSVGFAGGEVGQDYLQGLIDQARQQ